MANTDTWAFFLVFSFFLLLGVTLPFVNSAFGEDFIEHDTKGLPGENTDVQNSVPSMFEVALSIFTIFFWSFGQLNFWIDLILITPLRILGFWLIFRMVRGN